MGLRAECVHGAAARLCLALIFGLLLVPGYVVAPTLFAHAPSVTEAGMYAGKIFHISNVGVLLLAAALAAFWLRLKSRGRLNWTLLVLCAAVVAAGEYGISPVLAELKAVAGSLDGLPKDDPLRARFGMWHGISAAVHLVATLLAAALVALGGKGAPCRR